MGYQPRVVVEKGDEVALSPFATDPDQRPVHPVALPQVVGELRLEFSSILQGRRCGSHGVVLVEEPIDRREARPLPQSGGALPLVKPIFYSCIPVAP